MPLANLQGEYRRTYNNVTYICFYVLVQPRAELNMNLLVEHESHILWLEREMYIYM